MEQNSNSTRKWIGRTLGVVVVVAAAYVLWLVIGETEKHPRTNDASVRANFIEIAPEVSGRLIELPVKDNAQVKKGDLLFIIDPRPYEFALQQALSAQEALEQQIVDAHRHIAAQKSAVEAAQAGVQHSHTSTKTAASSVDAARATVVRAQAATTLAETQLKLATNNLHRVEPLLQKQYVTVEQVDQVRTAMNVAQSVCAEAQASLVQAQAGVAQAVLRQQEADDVVFEVKARLGQAEHAVDTVDTLKSQRAALAARVENARLDLERTRVTAPFDAYVTNMNISTGAYARPGGAIFTLIDTRTWYVVANYRESYISNIHTGSPVDVYLMGHSDRKFEGVVESVGFGVFPEDGRVSSGLPDVQRTLNWVHLSTRFPVRVRVQNPDPALFRIGATAVTVVR